jgi:hypothetical protein
MKTLRLLETCKEDLADEEAEGVDDEGMVVVIKPAIWRWMKVQELVVTVLVIGPALRRIRSALNMEIVTRHGLGVVGDHIAWHDWRHMHRI